MAQGTPLNVGVIGTGHLGSLHARLWREVETARLVGLVDYDQARAEAVARETKCRAFPAVVALLAEVDAVSIVTPTSSHAAVAAEAIAARKHVFIEKPITRTEEEAASLIRAAKRSRYFEVASSGMCTALNAR